MSGKFRPVAYISVFMMSCAATAALQADTVFSPEQDGWVRSENPSVYTDAFLEGGKYSSMYSIDVAEQDVGKQADLYLAASIGETWYMHDGEHFRQWPGKDLNLLVPHSSKVLEATESLEVLSESTLFAGHYQVFAGYKTPGGELTYSKPLRFTVQSQADDHLLKFRSATAMESYLKSSMQEGAAEYSARYASAEDGLGGFPVTDLAAESFTVSASGKASNRVSSTNLQTEGVDEADTIKVSGNQLYMLKGCDGGVCLDVHNLNSNTASNELLASYPVGAGAQPDSLYLVENGEDRKLVTLSGRNSYAWRSLWAWSAGSTTVGFLNASDPENIAPLEMLTLDGSLVSSKRVGDTLYLVTRFTPAVKEFEPYPHTQEAKESNENLLAQTALETLLPSITNSDKISEPLVSADNCYMAASGTDRNVNPSIITITGVSVSSQAVVSTACFLGNSETLYMTTQSLYLATTSWNYSSPFTDELRYQPSHSTTLHKFALGENSIEYRGSGLVKGHLGWSEDKKSFRMGENGDYLNIATSVGEDWNVSASTRLTVLKESNGSLQTVSTIDGIGKPGEQLYAARFLGDRAYLVTFRVTDPLYVVDLSDQENPRLAGELEISGYSDYLHPVSETLLLGIGKDAIADERSTERGLFAGSWSQGVKLALFDVSDPSDPREIESEILGKRGTESEVLFDHHAFTWLPANGIEPARIAIPVRLHEEVPKWEDFNPSQPSAWWDYTHTALYSFELSSDGVTPVGRIEGSNRNTEPNGVVTIGIPTFADFAPSYYNFSDRSVLADEAVYYIHKGTVLSSFWGDTKALPEALPIVLGKPEDNQTMTVEMK